MSKYWNIESTNLASMIIHDPNGYWHAFVKWDGCIDLTRHFNTPIPNTKPDDIDTIHICDVDDLIERLKELKEIAKNHFSVWPQ